MELDNIFNHPNPGAISRWVLETVFGDDYHDNTGSDNRIEDCFEIISRDKIPCIKEYTRLTNASLDQLVFREFSLTVPLINIGDYIPSPSSYSQISFGRILLNGWKENYSLI